MSDALVVFTKQWTSVASALTLEACAEIKRASRVTCFSQQCGRFVTSLRMRLDPRCVRLERCGDGRSETHRMG